MKALTLKRGKNIRKLFTYSDLSNKQISLLFFNSKVRAEDDFKFWVVIVDISHHYVYSSSGRLKQEENKTKIKKVVSV